MNFTTRGLFVSLAIACGSAWGQAYPSRPLKVILPVPAGGYYDWT